MHEADAGLVKFQRSGTMLVLERKKSESIEIGNGIIVTVVSIKKGRVNIAIEAPREINIRRTEIARKDAA